MANYMRKLNISYNQERETNDTYYVIEYQRRIEYDLIHYLIRLLNLQPLKMAQK